jgi:hypothetical protein
VPTTPNQPWIKDVPRSAPPAIPKPIKLLMNKDPNVNPKFVVPNPPVYTTMSKKREVKAMWRHYSKEKKALRAPLPLAEVDYLKAFAMRTGPPLPKTAMQSQLEEQFKLNRALTGRFQGRYHVLSARFLRRRYQKLLAEYIPVITEENGEWRVDQVVPPSTQLPRVNKRHLGGYTLSCGAKIEEVDTNGAFINQRANRRT